MTNKSNHPLLPQSLRGLIVGKSGCGKTTLLLNLLLQPVWLDYSKLSVFGKSLFQPEYRILKKGFEEQLPKKVMMNLFENQNTTRTNFTKCADRRIGKKSKDLFQRAS